MSQTDQNQTVNVQITIGDIKVQFNGSTESVMNSVISFLSKQVPAIDLARKISLNYAVSELVEKYSSFIKITPEGPRVISESGIRLSDKEMIVLQLIASRIAKDLGKAKDDGLQVSEIQSSTALNPKSVSSRLSELAKAGMVSRDETETSKYRITTAGIHWMNSNISKKRQK